MRRLLLPLALLATACTLDVGRAPSTFFDATADAGATDAGATDPGAADPGAADPGAADPGEAADPGIADPGGPAPDVTPDPGGAPDPGAPDPGLLDPGAPDEGAPDLAPTDPGAPDLAPTDPGPDADEPTCGVHPLPAPPAGVRLNEAYDGGVDEDPATAANTAWTIIDLGTSSTATFDAAPSGGPGGADGLALRMTTETVGATPGPAVVLVHSLQDFTGDTLYARTYVHIDPATTGDAGFAMIVSTGPGPDVPAAKLMLDPKDHWWLLRLEGTTTDAQPPVIGSEAGGVWRKLEMAVCGTTVHGWIDDLYAGSIDLGATSTVFDLKLEGLPVPPAATPLTAWIDDTLIWTE